MGLSSLEMNHEPAPVLGHTWTDSADDRPLVSAARRDPRAFGAL